MMSNLLFLGTPPDALPTMGRALSLGYGLYACDGNPFSPGLTWVRRYGLDGTVASVYDPDQVLNEVRRNNWQVDGVLAVGVDVGPVVSIVATELGLPCIPYEISRLSWDKVALKDRFKAGGVPVPGSTDFVIKPVDERGGRGVHVLAASTVARNSSEVREAEQAGQSGRVLFERFVPGPQVSAEALVWDGRVIFCGLTDRLYQYSQTIENGGRGPSRFEGTATGDCCHDTVRQVVRVLGIRSGTIKLDLVLDAENGGQVTVIEAAIGRLSGGLMCSHYLPLAYDVDFLQGVFDVVTGRDPCPLFSRPTWGYPTFVSGRYEMPGTPNQHRERGRFFLALGRTREEAEKKATRWLEGKRNDLLT